MTAGYRPTDKEADRHVRLLSRWARRYAKGGKPFERETIRLYLRVAARSNDPTLERRILQEFGRRGAFAKNKKAEARKRREREENDRKRQFSLPLETNE